MSKIKEIGILENGNFNITSLGADATNIDINELTEILAQYQITATDLANLLIQLIPIIDNKTDKGHSHGASDIITGILPIERGGTGKNSFSNGKVLGGDANGKLIEIPLQSTATLNNSNPITSGAVYSEIQKMAIKNHASTEKIYGISSSSNYGHVKMTDNFTETAEDGLVPSLTAIQKAIATVGVEETACTVTTDVNGNMAISYTESGKYETIVFEGNTTIIDTLYSDNSKTTVEKIITITFNANGSINIVES